MKGFRLGFIRSFTQDYQHQEDRNRQERVETYRQRIDRGLPIFEDAQPPTGHPRAQPDRVAPT